MSPDGSWDTAEHLKSWHKTFFTWFNLLSQTDWTTHLLLLNLINIPRNIHSIEIHFGNPSNRLIKEKNKKKEWFAKRMTQNQKINLEVKRPESMPAMPLVTAERPNSSAPAQRGRPNGTSVQWEEGLTQLWARQLCGQREPVLLVFWKNRPWSWHLPPSSLGPKPVTLIRELPTQGSSCFARVGGLRSNAHRLQSSLISSLGVLCKERLQISTFIKGKT